MNTNPLFPTSEPPTPPEALPQPTQNTSHSFDNNPAVTMIRKKLATLYATEPNLRTELAQTPPAPHSKHQQFMKQLQASGKSLAELQTAWHEYYMALPDEEKHSVWQEFYQAASSSRWGQYFQPAAPEPHRQPPTVAITTSGVTVSSHEPPTPPNTPPSDIRQRLRQHVQANAKLKPKQHLHSLAFGLASGIIVVVIFLFGFFNEMIIAPFIQPSRQVSGAPLIIDNSTVTASNKTEIIIPKINLQIPVDFSQTTTEEKVIEGALDSGIVHYPSTAKPGQKGNGAYFGHSSNNIFNPGKYKFAFVLLKKLTVGDTFYITHEGKLYAYQVIDRKIVPPTEVGVLNDTHGHQATAALITCDPPGTSINRLVVTGTQISPSPTEGAAPTNTPTVSQPVADLPGNGPSLWSRLWQAIR